MNGSEFSQAAFHVVGDVSIGASGDCARRSGRANEVWIEQRKEGQEGRDNKHAKSQDETERNGDPQSQTEGEDKGKK